MRRARSLTILLLASLALGACTSGGGASIAPSVAAPSVAPTTAASVDAVRRSERRPPMPAPRTPSR